MSILRNSIVLLCAISLFAFAACGDSGSNPGTDEGAATDQAGTDATAPGDSTGTDQGTPEDTAKPEDTATPEDTAKPGDTLGPEDTAVADTTPAGAICLDHFDCLVEACSATTGAGMADCMATAAKTCGLDAADAEHGYAMAVGDCLGANTCPIGDGSNTADEGWADFYKCAKKWCSPEIAICTVGATAGEGHCDDLRACVKSCELDFITGKPENACVRACASKASLESVQFYVDLELCVAEQCHDKEDKDSCFVQSVGTFCPNENDLCYGTQL